MVFSSSQVCNCSDLSQATSSKMLTFDTTCDDTVKMKPAPEKFRHHGLITVYLNKVSFCSIVEQTGRTLADICYHGNTTTGSSYITQSFLSEFAFSIASKIHLLPLQMKLYFAVWKVDWWREHVCIWVTTFKHGNSYLPMTLSSNFGVYVLCVQSYSWFLVSLQLQRWRAKTLIAWKSLCCQGFRKQEKTVQPCFEGMARWDWECV